MPVELEATQRKQWHQGADVQTISGRIEPAIQRARRRLQVDVDLKKLLVAAASTEPLVFAPLLGSQACEENDRVALQEAVRDLRSKGRRVRRRVFPTLGTLVKLTPAHRMIRQHQRGCRKDRRIRWDVCESQTQTNYH